MNKSILWLIVIFVLFSSTYAYEVNTDDIISQHLTNSTGGIEAIGDYSSTPQAFYIAPPANETWILSRMLVYIEDVGTFDTNAYGNAITLTDGIQIISYSNNITTILSNGRNITKTTDWAGLCYDLQVFDFGTGSEFATVRWTFSKSGAYIELNGANNDNLSITFSDDLSGLEAHSFLIQGYKLQKSVTTTSNASGAGGISMISILIIGLLFFMVYVVSQWEKLDTFTKPVLLFVIAWLIPIVLFITSKIIELDYGTGSTATWLSGLFLDFFGYGVYFAMAFSFIVVGYVLWLIHDLALTKDNDGAGDYEKHVGELKY